MLSGESNVILKIGEPISSDLRVAWTLFMRGKDLEVLTDKGFKRVNRIRRLVVNKLIRVQFENGLALNSTEDHVIVAHGEPIIMQDISLRKDIPIPMLFPKLGGERRYINCIEAVLRQGPDWLPSYLYVDSVKSLLETLTKGIDWRSFFTELGFKANRTAYSWLRKGKCPLSLIRSIILRYGDITQFHDVLSECTLTVKRGRSNIPLLVDMERESFKLLVALAFSSLHYVDLSCEKGIITFRLKKKDDRNMLIDSLRDIESKATIRTNANFVKVQDKCLYIFFRWIIGISPQIRLRRVIKYPLSLLKHSIISNIVRYMLSSSGDLVHGDGSSCNIASQYLSLDVLRICAPMLTSFRIRRENNILSLSLRWASSVLPLRIFTTYPVRTEDLKGPIPAYDVSSSDALLVLSL